MQQNAESLIDVHGAAQFLCLSVSTVYKLTSSKKLHHYKLNGALRFSPQRLKAYVEQHSVEPIKSRD